MTRRVVHLPVRGSSDDLPLSPLRVIHDQVKDKMERLRQHPSFDVVRNKLTSVLLPSGYNQTLTVFVPVAALLLVLEKQQRFPDQDIKGYVYAFAMNIAAALTDGSRPWELSDEWLNLGREKAERSALEMEQIETMRAWMNGTAMSDVTDLSKLMIAGRGPSDVTPEDRALLVEFREYLVELMGGRPWRETPSREHPV